MLPPPELSEKFPCPDLRAIYLHPAPTFANKAGESGRISESCESFPNGNIRGAVACSFAKTRARQDAERSLRDAGAPREEISLPERQ
jgi:hypothetical protein